MITMTTEPTPAKVLTKSQLKRAARDSKVRTRNVLFNPFRLQWPPVSREAAAAVLVAVETQFDQFDIQQSLSQEEYSALLAAGDRAGITARRREIRAAAEPLLAARRSHLAHCVLGFNAASRALESGRLAALLVEADTPALETRYLLPLAAGRRCPAVCLPRLRPTLQRRLGLSTAVLGLLEDVTAAGHHLRPLFDAVCAAASPLILRRAITAAEDESVPAEDQSAPTEDESAPTEDTRAPAESTSTTDGDLQTSGTKTTGQFTPDESSVTAGKDQPATATPAEPPSPAPFEQSDFISLSVSPPSKRRAPADPLLDLISIDTEGVPHKKRLQLKEASVMRITLGNKAQKKAARAAKKMKGGRNQ